jgi:hypothetical protein
MTKLFPGADEALRRTLLTGPKADRQRQRQREALTIAKGLAGEDVLDLRLVTLDGIHQVINERTGEVVEAGPGEGRALRYAWMHLLGAAPENHAVGIVEEVHEDGRTEYHEEATAQTRHGSRLCGNYIEALRRKNRSHARRAVRRAQASMTPGEWYQHRNPHMRGRLAWTFLTLTLPRVEQGSPFLEVRRFVRAFDLFRKRDAWKAHVRAGIKGVEMKFNVFMGTVGIHVHGHLMILSRWWKWQDLRAEWFACVQQATLDVYGVELDAAALESQVEGGVITDIRTIKSQHHEGEMALEDALQETLKYVTKPDDWDDLVQAGAVGRRMLLELEDVARWPRMFELLGTAREAKQTDADMAAAEGGRGFLDTACLNDGNPNGPDEDHPLEGADSGNLCPEAGTPQGPQGTPQASPRPPPSERAPSWRELMDILPLGKWMAVMVERTRAARRYIARKILETRGGIWITLDGLALGAGEPERVHEPIRRRPSRLPELECPIVDLWEGTEFAMEATR